MRNIDFKEIKPKQLVGRWQVKDRIISKSDPSSIFASADEHHFYDNGIYKVSSTEDVLGQWEISFASEVIHNPLINFTLYDKTISAMITRLQCEDDCNEARLTIYLATGLELVLLKDHK